MSLNSEKPGRPTKRSGFCSLGERWHSLKLLELFAGTRSIGRAFEQLGHEVYSIDWDDRFENIDWCIDINEVRAEDILRRFGVPDVIWASPDCTSYSIAAISKHRFKDENGYLKPKSEYAGRCDETNIHVLNLIGSLNPKYYFIENPRGGMRKTEFMEGIPRYTITYCQYGDKRMKPTDIWTNHPNPAFKALCKNGAPCHEAAPRGSKTGTQGVKSSILRAIIPEGLCRHIASICSSGDTSTKNERRGHQEAYHLSAHAAISMQP
jgi:site-specific DNA-cytosine methylase